MKYVGNPLTPLPKNPKSHVYGWSRYWADLLGAELVHKDFSKIQSDDAFHWDHGANFGGRLNLFSGITDDLVENIKHLVQVKPSLVSLDCKMPNFGNELRRRKQQPSCSKNLTADLINEFEGWLETSSTLYPEETGTENIAIGDSHATAFADKDTAVIKMNGKTLWGFLNEEPTRVITRIVDKPYKKITLVFGSIDIRHHLWRRKTPYGALKEMLNTYELLVKILLSAEYEVEVAGAVPVEWENRRVPRTGWYKGTPFYGPLKERQKLTSEFNKILVSTMPCPVVLPPDEWYTMDPKMYAESIMELGSSVHIAPLNYRSKRDDWQMLGSDTELTKKDDSCVHGCIYSL